MNWEVKADQSALKYTLQISKTQDFSNILFTKNGIQSSSYNLAQSNLPTAGVYYWRVNAANDTGGVSPWSNSWSFEVIPASGLIITIAVTIILLIIAIVIFGIIALVNRRKYGG